MILAQSPMIKTPRVGPNGMVLETWINGTLVSKRQGCWNFLDLEEQGQNDQREVFMLQWIYYKVPEKHQWTVFQRVQMTLPS